jgi:hypothetical protein
MSWVAKTVAGLLLMLAGVGGLVFGIVKVASIGTCASGGPYVSARPCPSHTGLYIGLIIGGVLVFLIGGAVFATRGRRAIDPGLPPTSDPMHTNPEPWSRYPTS